MRPLSKKSVTVNVDIHIEPEEKEKVLDGKMDRGLDELETKTKDLGYSDFTVEIVPTPYITKEGTLLARGSFRGPSPFAKESRSPDDISDFHFLVVEDENGKTILQIDHETARIATFEMTNDGLKGIDGDLPHVNEGFEEEN